MGHSSGSLWFHHHSNVDQRGREHLSPPWTLNDPHGNQSTGNRGSNSDSFRETAIQGLEGFHVRNSSLHMARPTPKTTCEARFALFKLAAENLLVTQHFIVSPTVPTFKPGMTFMKLLCTLLSFTVAYFGSAVSFSLEKRSWYNYEHHKADFDSVLVQRSADASTMDECKALTKVDGRSQDEASVADEDKLQLMCAYDDG
ncbi:hypothetical protein DFJ77DRAFT_240798 [Powellomyces hirtus]|nr:hypothetical protein DFJ77DRAFT_240798 [Powellomyces hirtus]